MPDIADSSAGLIHEILAAGLEPDIEGGQHVAAYAEGRASAMSRTDDRSEPTLNPPDHPIYRGLGSPPLVRTFEVPLHLNHHRPRIRSSSATLYDVHT